MLTTVLYLNYWPILYQIGFIYDEVLILDDRV